MPIAWEYEDGGLVVFRVMGMLTKTGLDNAQTQAEPEIQKGGAKLLVIADGFTGWDKDGNWEDLSFTERNDPYIEKMAIVGDEQWRDLAYTFTLRGLRGFPIEYFSAGEEAAARGWLDE